MQQDHQRPITWPSGNGVQHDPIRGEAHVLQTAHIYRHPESPCSGVAHLEVAGRANVAKHLTAGGQIGYGRHVFSREEVCVFDPKLRMVLMSWAGTRSSVTAMAVSTIESTKPLMP